MKPFISVCLIVKDEEKFLKRCLETVNGIADEIIVADTGSTDRTKSIALEYTNMVYDYRWEDDFSKARNFAASKASGEWIVVLDADEFVDRESFGDFKESLQDKHMDHNILAVQIVNFVGENGKDTVLNFHERVYKNDGTINYYRNIHEMLKHNQSLECRGIAGFQIYHSGYMISVMKEKNKSNRNLLLLKQKKKKEAIDYYFLGNEYFVLGDFNKAIEFYKKGFQLKESIHLDWVQKLLVRLVNCLESVHRYKEAMDVIESCESVFIDLVDFKFLKGKVLYVQEKNIEARKIFQYILQNKDQLRADSSPDYLEYLPHKYLGELFEKEDQLHLAVHHYSSALSINDADDYIWIRIIDLLAKHSSLEELIQFINNNCLNRTNMTVLRLVKILLSIQNLDVQRLSRSFLNTSNLSLDEEVALLLKNLFLDGKRSEIVEIINSKSPDEFISLLSKEIFKIFDFVLLVIETDNEKYKIILKNLKLEASIENLLNLLLGKGGKKLSLFEEEFFILTFRQAYTMKLDKVITSLKDKKEFLSIDGKKKIKKILNT
jgi:glycosyltransferase involved in cell wall biosynthesis